MEGTARIAHPASLLAAVVVVLAAALVPVARADTGLVLDPTWAGGSFGHEFPYGDQGPRAMASDDQRVWVLSNRAGATSGAVLQLRRADGSADPALGAGGEVMVDVGASADVPPYGWDIVALPGGSAAVLTDRVETGSSDLALEVLRPDGTPDPAYFGGDGRTVVAGPGVETPMRLAYDAGAQRFLVAGQTILTQGGVADTFVAAITHGGAPDAGFGTAGFRIFDGGASAATDGSDFGDAITPLGGGRVAAWYRWNAGGAIFDPAPRTGLRVLTAAGVDDPTFSGDGDLQTPELTYGRDLALVGGELVGVGSRTSGSESESMVMRIGLDGAGLTQAPVELVPGESEGLDQLVATPGALLVAGQRLTRNFGPLQRLAIAARLSPLTLQPLERGLLDAPGAREGHRDVAAAPGMPGGLLLTTYVTPNDTAVFRAIPGTLPAGGGPGNGRGDGPGPGGGPGARDITAPRIRGLTATAVIRFGPRPPAVAAAVPPGFAFTLSERAMVTLSFQVRRGGRWQARRGARVVLRGVRAGARRVRFTGRLSARRSLALGRYRVTVMAVDAAGNASAPARAAFRLISRARP